MPLPSSISRKGQWSTKLEHLSVNHRGFSEWNAAYFTRKAMTIGPNTVDVIKTILASRKLEVQNYRLCLGVLNFTKKYSKQTLEECCKQALELNKVTYTFIKNSTPAISEELGTFSFNHKINEERNKGAFVISTGTMDIDNLLSRSQNLAQHAEKEGDE